ncbi:hypothetical protein EC178200_4425 [Escherichia coli 178200]|nr:hypothetical protein EC178200_4425 [Escherichia coli 178200]
MAPTTINDGTRGTTAAVDILKPSIVNGGICRRITRTQGHG